MLFWEVLETLGSKAWCGGVNHQRYAFEEHLCRGLILSLSFLAAGLAALFPHMLPDMMFSLTKVAKQPRTETIPNTLTEVLSGIYHHMTRGSPCPLRRRLSLPYLQLFCPKARLHIPLVTYVGIIIYFPSGKVRLIFATSEEQEL